MVAFEAGTHRAVGDHANVGGEVRFAAAAGGDVGGEPVRARQVEEEAGIGGRLGSGGHAGGQRRADDQPGEPAGSDDGHASISSGAGPRVGGGVVANPLANRVATGKRRTESDVKENSARR